MCNYLWASEKVARSASHLSSKHTKVSINSTMIRLRRNEPSFFIPKKAAILSRHPPPPAHTVPFGDKNEYLLPPFENKTSRDSCFCVFKFFRFWCSHYGYAFLFTSIFIQLQFCQRMHLPPFLGWINVDAKPKTELNMSIFM